MGWHAPLRSSTTRTVFRRRFGVEAQASVFKCQRCRVAAGVGGAHGLPVVPYGSCFNTSAAVVSSGGLDVEERVAAGVEEGTDRVTEPRDPLATDVEVRGAPDSRAALACSARKACKMSLAAGAVDPHCVDARARSRRRGPAERRAASCPGAR